MKARDRGDVFDQRAPRFVAWTVGERAFDIDFPMHPQTLSTASVSDLLTRPLAVISQHAEGRTDVSDGDILQALAMAGPIRGRMLDSDRDGVFSLAVDLQEKAWEAADMAKSYPASRA